MSAPQQEQPTWPARPASAPPYGPAQQPNAYGQPQPTPHPAPVHGTPYGQPAGPSGYPSYPPAPGTSRNGFAITSLIFGILGGIPLGIGFGIAGLVRAAKVGRGRVMSVVGIGLSALWLALVIVLIPHLAKASDPGCVAAKNTVTTYGNTKLSADANDPTAMKNDLRTLVTDLNSAADKANNDAARTAIKKLAADFNELLNDLNTSTLPAADIQSRIDADANAVDSACGTIG